MYSNLRLLCICFFFCHISYAAEINTSSQPELQVLIDVSGSMKRTDSKNLRIPALKLLINLLPNGTKAGIWLFAEKATVLQETGIVNQLWKKRALEKLKKIHSKGLYTNIEDGIQKSCQHWFDSLLQKKSLQQKRNLIILTDGVVDISKDIMLSAESRERVMVDQVQLLQRANVKVQTISLSDDADVELMDKLAFDTNGWSETAQSAEQLQKLFFKLYKKAVPQDSIPIKGNTFVIDASINEFSLLIFKKPDASATQLMAPDKTKISSASSADNISWLNEKNYDLVTVKKPKVGEWVIFAEIDQDNQVMIVTDLKFNVDEMPNHLSKNESYDLTAYFSDKHKLISREDFLSLIDISIEHTDERGQKNKWKMLPVATKPGLFSKSIGTGLSNGKHSLKIIADSKTFQRESIQTIEVVDSPVTIETKLNLTARSVRIRLIPNRAVLDSKVMTIHAAISQIDQQTKTDLVEQKDGVWEITINVPDSGGSKIINFSIMAKTTQGKSVSPNVKPVIINDQFFVTKLSKQTLKPTITKEKVTETELIKIDEEVEQEEEETVDIVPEKENVNWIKTTIIVISINIVLIVAGFFVFKMMRKKTAEQQAKLLDRLD